LGTSMATIPANIPYIFPDDDRLDRWRNTLGSITGFKIGIAWQGNPKYPNDRQRSFPLAQLAPIARIPDVRLVSLQVGFGREQLAAWDGEWRVPSPERRIPTDRSSTSSDDSRAIIDLGACLDEGGAFIDTAAVLKCLDLVIAPNTAIIH